MPRGYFSSPAKQPPQGEDTACNVFLVAECGATSYFSDLKMESSSTDLTLFAQAF